MRLSWYFPPFGKLPPGAPMDLPTTSIEALVATVLWLSLSYSTLLFLPTHSLDLRRGPTLELLSFSFLLFSDSSHPPCLFLRPSSLKLVSGSSYYSSPGCLHRTTFPWNFHPQSVPRICACRCSLLGFFFSFSVS